MDNNKVHTHSSATSDRIDSFLQKESCDTTMLLIMYITIPHSLLRMISADGSSLRLTDHYKLVQDQSWKNDKHYITRVSGLLGLNMECVGSTSVFYIMYHG